MAKLGNLCMTGLVFVSLACSVFANTGNHSQTPDMTNGFAFSSQNIVPSVVADDWTGTNGNAITGISWWGAYWTPNGSFTHYSDSLGNASAGGIESFTLTIYGNLPAVAGNSLSYAKPGSALLSETYSASAITEEIFGAGGKGRTVYKYTLNLDQNDWLAQPQGQTYWVSIVANTNSQARQWGWYEANDHSGATAVQDLRGAGWTTIENNAYGNDMAFELLTNVPEPGSLAALLMGGAGVLGWTIKSRKRS